MHYTMYRNLATSQGGRKETGKRKNSVLYMTPQNVQRPRQFLFFNTDTNSLLKGLALQKCMCATVSDSINKTKQKTIFLNTEKHQKTK